LMPALKCKESLENRKAFTQGYSAVVGSIVLLISETLLAGNPPWLACSRTIFSLGAI
jgi:hypothetical protein